MENINDKKSLVHHLLKKISLKETVNQNIINDEKKLNLINVNMGNFCGNQCLTSFNATSLTPQEELCLTSCSKSYYDSVEKGQVDLIQSSFKF